ncbi:MAG: ABC transporter substrate-binding protein [Desulfobacteraceae bacterium]|nr:ABC transporter substrate-binding protein [Desulfobacteraceae bacterium]
MEKRLLLGLALILILFSYACEDVHANSSKTRTIIDAKGNTVIVPNRIRKVANLWNSANEILVQLGAGDIFVGGSVYLKKRPWMTRIFPKAQDVAIISQGGVANVEAVLGLDPDFTISVAGRADLLIEIGEPVIQLTGGKTIEDLFKQIGIIAEALGPEYQKNAELFFGHCKKNLNYVIQKTADIPYNEQMTVLHGSTSSTVIDNSLSGDLLKKLNMKNAFPNTNSSTISYENILKANPDIIIVATGRYKEYEKFMTDPIYADIKAIKHNRVFINPSGMFFWDAYSGEIALEILWLAKTIYPEKFKELNLNKEVKNFYRFYFDFCMSDDEVAYLLAGKDPYGQWQ